VQAECRNLGEYDAPEVDPTLTAAVAALRDRPVLFKYCAEEVSEQRGRGGARGGRGEVRCTTVDHSLTAAEVQDRPVLLK
jgi:hypothetical protein